MFPLHQSVQSEHVYTRNSRKCGFLWLNRCCEDRYIGVAQRTIVLYGCIKNITNQALYTQSMYVYGGSFTSQKVNPVTSTQKCPIDVKEAGGPNDIKVCLAERVTSNVNNLPYYGGMFSCDYGNPALASNSKGCPTNYNLYAMGTIEGNCILNVCLKFETYDTTQQLPSIVLPPFSSIESVEFTTEVNETMESGIVISRMMHEADVIEVHASPIVTSGSSELRFPIKSLSIGILVVVMVQYWHNHQK